MTSLFPTIWALVAEVPFSLSSSLSRTSAWVVAGKVNRAMPVCAVAVSSVLTGVEPVFTV